MTTFYDLCPLPRPSVLVQTNSLSGIYFISVSFLTHLRVDPSFFGRYYTRYCLLVLSDLLGETFPPFGIVVSGRYIVRFHLYRHKLILGNYNLLNFKEHFTKDVPVYL